MQKKVQALAINEPKVMPKRDKARSATPFVPVLQQLFELLCAAVMAKIITTESTRPMQ